MYVDCSLNVMMWVGEQIVLGSRSDAISWVLLEWSFTKQSDLMGLARCVSHGCKEDQIID